MVRYMFCFYVQLLTQCSHRNQCRRVVSFTEHHSVATSARHHVSYSLLPQLPIVHLLHNAFCAGIRPLLHYSSSSSFLPLYQMEPYHVVRLLPELTASRQRRMSILLPTSSFLSQTSLAT